MSDIILIKSDDELPKSPIYVSENESTHFSSDVVEGKGFVKCFRIEKLNKMQTQNFFFKLVAWRRAFNIRQKSLNYYKKV